MVTTKNAKAMQRTGAKNVLVRKAAAKKSVTKAAAKKSVTKAFAKKSATKRAPKNSATKPAKKAPTKPIAAPKRPAASAAPANDVAALIAAMPRPQRDAIVALRDIILTADASIAEGIKWNSPSFRTTEYFATMNHRPGKGLMVVLHLGAKVRDTAKTGIAVDDPTGLLQWLAKDRAVLTFPDLPAVQAKREAFAALIRSWIRHV